MLRSCCAAQLGSTGRMSNSSGYSARTFECLYFSMLLTDPFRLDLILIPLVPFAFSLTPGCHNHQTVRRVTGVASLPAGSRKRKQVRQHPPKVRTFAPFVGALQNAKADCDQRLEGLGWKR